MLVHGIRRSELIKVLDESAYPVVHHQGTFKRPSITEVDPVLFSIDELFISIAPVPAIKHNWDVAPADSIIIDVTIKPVNDLAVDTESLFQRESGIGAVQVVPAGIQIRRTVTMVGGTTTDNILYQLRLICVSALHLLGEDCDETE